MHRDQEIARQIGKAEEVARQLQRQIKELFEDAYRQHAAAHAGLYLAVKAELDTAIEALGEAYEVMAHGDPEDFA